MEWTQWGYLSSTLLFVVGLKFLSHPRRAALGNTIAAGAMILAVGLTAYNGLTNGWSGLPLLIAVLSVALGLWIGKRMSDRIEMTRMPQLISLFNATGGGCAVLLGIAESHQSQGSAPFLQEGLVFVSVVIGGLSATGSIVAYAKLAGRLRGDGGRVASFLAKALPAVIVLLFVAIYTTGYAIPSLYTALMLATLALLYGVFFVWPIGGADMPVVISLLNALTGVATAVTGVAYDNRIMLAGGVFVGAAGILLTLMMCKAMNRSLWQVFLGGGGSGLEPEDEEGGHILTTTAPETAMQLAFASKIAVIPGYGLAVSQAQSLCGQLYRMLNERQIQTDFIIHPVAGRMPGHMNVLLAEADIPYESLVEMEEVNDHMAEYDLVLIIGANDVVNPAAEWKEDSPIYGMPIIRAHQSKKVVVVKRGMSAGYSGLRNELFYHENCRLLFGDARAVLRDVISQVKVI